MRCGSQRPPQWLKLDSLGSGMLSCQTWPLSSSLKYSYHYWQTLYQVPIVANSCQMWYLLRFHAASQYNVKATFGKLLSNNLPYNWQFPLPPPPPHTHTHIRTHMHAHTHTCMHACTHARTHARTHTRTRTHTHTFYPAVAIELACSGNGSVYMQGCLTVGNSPFSLLNGTYRTLTFYFQNACDGTYMSAYGGC